MKNQECGSLHRFDCASRLQTQEAEHAACKLLSVLGMDRYVLQAIQMDDPDTWGTREEDTFLRQR